MTKKKMTIEDLAVMTQKGFLEVGVRFDRVEERLTTVETDVKIMKESFDQFITKLDEFISQMKKYEQENLLISVQMRRLESRIEKLESRKK